MSCTASDNEWQRVVQGVATSGTASDNVWQWMTASDNELYQVFIYSILYFFFFFFFFWIREEPITKHHK